MLSFCQQLGRDDRHALLFARGESVDLAVVREEFADAGIDGAGLAALVRFEAKTGVVEPQLALSDGDVGTA